MSPYLGELAGIMAVFSFAIVAPGADTAMVMRQSLVHGRRAGVLTAFGVGTSLLFHLTYTILGLGLIVRSRCCCSRSSSGPVPPT
jgi:Putative threonine efflux protein